MQTVKLVSVAVLWLIPTIAPAADTVHTWDFTGHTQPAATVELRPRVTGYITKIAVKEGDAVKKGDVLVEIASRSYELDMDAATARVRAAEAKLQDSRLTMSNSKKLVQNKVVSADELAHHETATMEAEAGLAAAKVEAERAKMNLAATQVKAPIDGRVSHIHFTEGNLAVGDQTPLVTLVATETLGVSFNVPEGILLQLRREGLAEPERLVLTIGFSGEEGNSHKAKLHVIAPDIDPVTATVRFRATIDNAEGLLSPGMSTRIRLSTQSK